jgi:hypothetical protein
MRVGLIRAGRIAAIHARTLAALTHVDSRVIAASTNAHAILLRRAITRKIPAFCERPTAGDNVPVPVPMAFYSFGGWKASLFGNTHIHGPDGASFSTQAKVVTVRWPRSVARDEAPPQFPTAI